MPISFRLFESSGAAALVLASLQALTAGTTLAAELPNLPKAAAQAASSQKPPMLNQKSDQKLADPNLLSKKKGLSRSAGSAAGSLQIGHLLDSTYRLRLGLPLLTEDGYVVQVLRRDPSLFFEARSLQKAAKAQGRPAPVTWNITSSFPQDAAQATASASAPAQKAALERIKKDFSAMTGNWNTWELSAGAYLWTMGDLIGSACGKKFGDEASASVPGGAGGMSEQEISVLCGRAGSAGAILGLSGPEAGGDPWVSMAKSNIAAAKARQESGVMAPTAQCTASAALKAAHSGGSGSKGGACKTSNIGGIGFNIDTPPGGEGSIPDAVLTEKQKKDAEAQNATEAHRQALLDEAKKALNSNGITLALEDYAAARQYFNAAAAVYTNSGDTARAEDSKNKAQEAYQKKSYLSQWAERAGEAGENLTATSSTAAVEKYAKMAAEVDVLKKMAPTWRQNAVGAFNTSKGRPPEKAQDGAPGGGFVPPICEQGLIHSMVTYCGSGGSAKLLKFVQGGCGGTWGDGVYSMPPNADAQCKQKGWVMDGAVQCNCHSDGFGAGQPSCKAGGGGHTIQDLDMGKIINKAGAIDPVGDPVGSKNLQQNKKTLESAGPGLDTSKKPTPGMAPIPQAK